MYMYKRIILYLLAIVNCVPLYAQSTARAARITLRAEEMLQESLPRVQGKIWPAGPLHGRSTIHNFATMEHIVQMQIESSRLPRDFKFLVPSPSLALAQEAINRYNLAEKSFEQFRKDMDVFLYYQAKPIERHEITPAERRQWLERLNVLKRQVEGLGAYLAPDDEGFIKMREYITYAYTAVEPALGNVLFIQPLEPRTDREFSLEEFCLHNPPEKVSSWVPPISWIRNRISSRKLPKELKVAGLNDRYSVLEQMEKSHQGGIFFPNGTIYTYTDATDLLKDIFSGRIRPDVILTDILVSQSGGGYYLASELRVHQYSGAIIAVTAYQEDKEVSLEMFRHGLDGLISLPIGFEYTSSWPSRIMQAVSNHFYYRQLHGWAH